MWALGETFSVKLFRITKLKNSLLIDCNYRDLLAVEIDQQRRVFYYLISFPFL